MAKRRKKRGDSPIVGPSGGTEALKAQSGVDKQQVVKTLQGYLHEAKEARKSGLNPRDDKWSQNLDLYWSRYDWSNKAPWQAKEVMPEVPVFVDRFAASLKEALVATPEGFYTIVDPADQEADLSFKIKAMTDVWLSTAGRNQVGQPLPFSAVFEEQMKLGAIMATASTVTWKKEGKYGRVAIDSVDPRYIWLDHTGRNLYRIRRVEIDRHELPNYVSAVDAAGKPIYHLDELNNLVSGLAEEDKRWEEERSGSGVQVSSNRKPVTMDEYVATVLDDQGKVIADRGLMVMANEQYLVRGPEANPFTHNKDWLVFSPLVTAPLSPYGRSYMEDFGSVAKTFTELTNMILDAVHTSSLKAFAMVPGMLLNPAQAAEGVSPNKLFMLEDGFDAKQFLAEIDLGTLSPDSFKVWQAIKNELREAASINEIGVGQFAPKGRTSATEIEETQQSSSALVRSIAQTVETRWLDPTLDLTWKTGLQHVRDDDMTIRAAVGEQMFAALIMQRKELIQRPITFQARGISTLIARAQQLKALLNVVSIISQNEILLKAFLGEVDILKLVHKLFELSNVDITQFQISQREGLIRSVTEPLGLAEQVSGQARPAAEGTQSTMKQTAQTFGIGK